MSFDYNEREIEFAKEVWKLIEKYGLKQQASEYSEYFSNDEPLRKNEIYISINEIFQMKISGYLDR